jgi:DHA2 family methylenomycin A resistance protein-like MFS transporter
MQNSKAQYLALTALCLGFFMVVMDVMIINLALPTMAQAFGGGIRGLQWVVDGYTLTFACLLLSAGHFADRIGAKAAYIWGLAFFILTSLACGMATNFLMLTIFRLLQGLSAALIVPTSLALINAAYTNKKARTQAIGIWSSTGGIAAASGPILGGILTHFFGWPAVFFVNIPVGIIAIVLTGKYVVNSAGNGHGNFDMLGQIFAIISIAALAFGLIEAGHLGWESVTVLGSFALFVLAFIIFLITEYYAATPMLPLDFFHSPVFLALVFSGIAINIAVFGELFIFTLYFQEVRLYSVLMTGFVLFPLTALTVLGSYLSGKISSVIGPKRPLIFGLSLGTIGFLSMLIAEQNSPAYFMFILPLSLIGLANSVAALASTIAIMHAVAPNQAGVASAAFTASRQIGSLIGVAIFGTIVSSSRNFIVGFHITLMISAALYFSALLLNLIIQPNHYDSGASHT